MVDVLGGTSDKGAESDMARLSNSKTADIVINGSLLETKLFIYGKVRSVLFCFLIIVPFFDAKQIDLGLTFVLISLR